MSQMQSQEAPGGFGLSLALRRWWLVVLLVLMGGGIGWGAQFFLAPVYESRAEFAFTIDFTRTGALTDIEEDFVLGIAGDILGSSEVLDRVVVQAEAQGIVISTSQRKEVFFIERRNQTWVLRVRYPDAGSAYILAGLWADEAQTVLQDAYRHALQAEGLRRYRDTLVGCMQNSVAVEPVHAVCNLHNLGAIQQELAKTGEALQAEKLASQGLMPALLFERSQTPERPERPVRFQRNTLILAGALIGLLVAGWVIPLSQGKKRGL